MSDSMDGYEGEVGATAQARQPALVASLPEPVCAVSAHAGDGQAQGRRLIYEGDYPPVTQGEAENAAHDLIAHFFKNEPRKGGGVLIGIPARPDQDTDLLLLRFLQEAERVERALRIALWNDARGRGWGQDRAIRFVESEITRIKSPPASVDTRPKDGDEGHTSAPLASSAVPSEETADAPTPHSGPSHDK